MTLGRRRSAGRRFPAALLLALALLPVAGCAGDERPPVPLAAPAPAPTPTPVTPAPALPSVADSTPRAQPEAPTTSAVRSPSSRRPSPSAPAATRRPLPTVAAPEQGGRYWAVFVAVAVAEDDPKLRQAAADLRDAGYDAHGEGSLACFQGAIQALGLPPDAEYVEVDVLFRDFATAELFVRQFGRPVEGIAEVRTFCRD